jgi:MFS family permease
MRRRALWVLGAVQLLVTFDVTVVTVVLEPIGDDLGLGAGALHWAIGAYAIAFGGLLLAGGRLADSIGRRRVLALGLAVLAAGSLGVAAAPSGHVLLSARALQGLGAALADPAAVGLLLGLFEGSASRTRALAMLSSVGSAGAAAGAVVGGLLAALVSWRAVFALTTLVGLVLLVALTRLPRDEGTGDRVDVRSALLVTLAATAVAVFLGTIADGVAPEEALLLVVAAGSAIAVVRRDRGSRRPFVPPALLGGWERRLVLVVTGVHGGMALGMYLLLALVLQGLLGWSPLAAGLGLLAMRGGRVGWARLAGWAIARYGGAWTTVAGMTLMTIGLAPLARLDPAPSYAFDVLPWLIVLGAAIPFVFIGVGSLFLHDVPAVHGSTASGVLEAVRWTGGALGLCVVAAAGARAHGEGSGAVTVSAIHAGALACVALGVVGVAAALVVVRLSGRATAAETQVTGTADTSPALAG